VRRRHDKYVAGEQRRPIEERHGDVVAVDDLGRLVTCDDGAERAARDAKRLSGQRRPT
jgi:hypothetical protein